VLSLLSLGKANPSDLARHVKLPRTTVMRTLEDLAVLEILDSNNSIFDADRDDKFMVNSERMEILKLINELAEDKSSPLSLPSVSEEDTVTRKIHIESERGIKSPCTPITGVLSGSFSSEQTIEVKSTEIKDKQPIRVNYGATELEEVKRDSDSTLHRPPLHFAMRPMRMYHGQYGLATHEQDKINLSR
jgi:DNA-binding transcriptional ArsR family regulator